MKNKHRKLLATAVIALVIADEIERLQAEVKRLRTHAQPMDMFAEFTRSKSLELELGQVREQYETMKLSAAAEIQRLRADRDKWQRNAHLVGIALDEKLLFVERVVEAITDKGPMPKYHDKIIAKQRKMHPTLWRALDELIKYEKAT